MKNYINMNARVKELMNKMTAEEMRQLFSQLYFTGSDALICTIESTGYDHFISHYVAQSRKAVRQSSPLASPFAIDYPQSHNGKLLIPFLAQGGTVILDPSLSKF